MANWTIYEQTILNSGAPQELSQYNSTLLQLLFNRGLRTQDEIEKFLHPSIQHLPPITKFKGMKPAVERIEKAIQNNEKIYIHGDYDVDGMSATAILWEYLYKTRGANILPYIPTRSDEGYGLTEHSVSTIHKRGASLIITVDCGIRDHEVIEKWTNKGVDFVVSDHHIIPEVKPQCPIVHPSLARCKDFEGISGACVSWFLCCALEYYRSPDNFSYHNVNGIDLCAISTLSDNMTALGINRTILWLGIEAIRTSKRQGILKLMKLSNIDPLKITSHDISFQLIPRLNSAGRIGDPLDSVRLLVTENPETAEKYSKKIDSINNERKELTQQIYDTAYQQISTHATNTQLSWAMGENWPEGVIGITAGRITAESNKVSIIISKREKDSIGSVRSISGINIVEVLDKFNHHLERYGGHDMAAGFTILNEKIDIFIEDVHKEIASQTMAIEPNQGRNIMIDLSLTPDDLTWKLYLITQQLRPFGSQNEQPLIALENARISDVKIVGERHLKFKAIGKINSIDCIGFGLADRLNLLSRGYADIVGSLDVNEWNGNEMLQLKIEDIR